MSKPPTQSIEDRVMKILLWAPADVIEEYKLKFLKMPIEVSRLDYFHPSNHEEWVNINRYCDFIRHKLSWSRDQPEAVQSTNRFWLGGCGQQNLPEHPVPGNSAQLAKPEIVIISSDEDEEPIDEIVRHRQHRLKAREVIVISSDDDEPLVETIIPRKRKAVQHGESSQGVPKRCAYIRIFEPDVISISDSDDEMTVVA